MAYAPPYRPSYDANQAVSSETRSVAQWLLAFAATVAVCGALATLVLFQITAEAPAQQSLRHATAALTEIDALLARHFDDIQAQAADSQPTDTIVVPDFPLDLGLTSADVEGLTRDELRVLILDRSAEQLYADGPGALRESAEDGGSLGLFSVAGFTDRALGILTETNHMRAGIAMGVVGLVAVALVLGAVSASRGWGKLGTAGLIVGLAGLATLLIAGVVRAYADSQDSGEFLRSELFGITSDHATVALLNGAGFAVTGLLFAAISLVMDRVSREATG
jgi:hypothetical protein